VCKGYFCETITYFPNWKKKTSKNKTINCREKINNQEIKMRFLIALIAFLALGQILGYFDEDFCGFDRCHARRRRRRCHRRWGCRFRGFDNDRINIDNEAIANSNSIAINTGDFGSADARSTSNAFNVNNLD